MKSHFKNTDLNSINNSRSSVQASSDKFPNLNKPLKMSDSAKESLQSLNSSALKSTIH